MIPSRHSQQELLQKLARVYYVDTSWAKKRNSFNWKCVCFRKNGSEKITLGSSRTQEIIVPTHQLLIELGGSGILWENLAKTILRNLVSPSEVFLWKFTNESCFCLSNGLRWAKFSILKDRTFPLITCKITDRKIGSQGGIITIKWLLIGWWVFC